ncbi:MAG: arginine--tRNA ligase [Deferrisomatales bacterium]
MRENLTDLLREAHRRAVAAGDLPAGELPHWKLELPKSPDHGDYATNLALVLASAAGMPPRKVAQILVDHLEDPQGIVAGVEVAGPGFINVRLDPSAWTRVLGDIEREGPEYGRSEVGAGRRVQVEFVSANPTGPLHVGHGRGAVVGDVLARILEAAGFRVEREYYVNDAGNQIRILGRSVLMRCRELDGEPVEFPEDHYRGEYVWDLARLCRQQWGNRYRAEPEEAVVEELGRWAAEAILEGIREDLERFGVRFDRWFSELALHRSGEVERILSELEERGVAYRAEGALWLATARYGDEKDRVLVKSDGLKTYFASDIAYHLDKFRRGFDEVVDVWGADHHGYVPRMKAALEAVGVDPARLQVLLVQFVTLLREGEPVGMSTRAGEFVTLREVIDEVGADAARFLFLTRSCDAPLDFDLEVAKKQTADNPVFYVQYAHARICSVFREAEKAAVAVPEAEEADLGRLELPEERELLKLLHLFPEVVEGSALNAEPHRIVYYLQDLAGQFHAYYNKHRFLGEDPGLTGARLCLAAGVRTVVRNALSVLGVEAPETM